MKKASKRLVRVVARDIKELERILISDVPICQSCGVVGKEIAENVFDNGGAALVSISDIRMAVSCQQGMNELHHYFELYAQDGGVLLHKLIIEVTKNDGY
jgi:glutamate dehydrogenase/leucine dehydrogenase